MAVCRKLRVTRIITIDLGGNLRACVARALATRWSPKRPHSPCGSLAGAEGEPTLDASADLTEPRRLERGGLRLRQKLCGFGVLVVLGGLNGNARHN